MSGDVMMPAVGDIVIIKGQTSRRLVVHVAKGGDILVLWHEGTRSARTERAWRCTPVTAAATE